MKTLSTATHWIGNAIAVFGLALPWITAIWVKDVLEREGTPTWPWEVILAPDMLFIEILATVLAAIPFFALAYGARYLLSATGLSPEEYAERVVVIACGAIAAAFGAVRDYYDLFYNPFEPQMSLFVGPWIAFRSSLFLICGLAVGFLLMLVVRVLIGPPKRQTPGTPVHG